MMTRPTLTTKSSWKMTRPATAPEQMPITVGLPRSIHSTNIQVSPAVAVAICVTSIAMPAWTPALTAEQWQQINALATSLRPDQALWISGYFAGIGHQARAAGGLGPPIMPSAVPPVEQKGPASSRSLTILFGSETGNSIVALGGAG